MDDSNDTANTENSVELKKELDSGVNDGKQNQDIDEDMLSISSGDFCEVDDCAAEALDVSSDEDLPKDENFDEEDIEEEIQWNIDQFLSDPSKLQNLRRPWNTALSKKEYADTKSLELFKGALDDLASECEFTVEDWDATLEELVSKSISQLLNRFIRDGDSSNLPIIICKWVKYGLSTPSVGGVHRDKDGKDESKLIRHFKIGFKFLQSIVSYHDNRFSEELLVDHENSPNVIAKLVYLIRENPISKIRFLAAENLYQCLTHIQDPFRAAQILRDGTDENGISHLDSLVQSISEASDQEETTKYVRIVHLVIERALLSLSACELREKTREVPQHKDAIFTVHTLFKEVECRFWKVCRFAKELKQMESQTFGIMEKGFVVESSCLLLAHAHVLEGAVEMVLQFYEKMFSTQLNLSLLSFVNGSPKALNLLMKLLLVFEKAHHEPMDLKSFDECPHETVCSRVHKLRETIAYGIRTLELLDQVKANSPKSSEISQLESEPLLEALHCLLNFASQTGQPSNMVTVLGSTHFSVLYEICEIVKAEKINRKRHDLLESNYADYCFQLMEHIMQHSSDFYLWLKYADKLKNVQASFNGVLSKSLLDWVSHVADPVIRSARDGSKSAIQRFKQRLSAATSKSDHPNQEVVMLLRLMETVITKKELSSQAAREQTIAALVNTAVPEIERIFRRSTFFQFSLWRMGTPIASEEAFNYRCTASSCMRILTVIYGEMVSLTGSNEGLSCYLGEVVRVLEVLSLTSGINEQLPSEEGLNLRKDALNLLDAIMHTDRLDEWSSFLLSLLEVTRPSLYPSVLSLLWVMAGEEDSKNEKRKAIREKLEHFQEWSGLARMVLYPSDYLLQLSIPTIKRLCGSSAKVAEKIAESFLDELRHMVLKRSVVKKNDVTDISDDEDTEDKKVDSNYIDTPLEAVSPRLLKAVDTINKFITSSKSLQYAMVGAIGTSSYRSMTWQILLDLCWGEKDNINNDIHNEYVKIFQPLSLSLCTIDCYSERLNDVITAQLAAEKAHEERRRKREEPVEGDCVDLNVFDEVDCESEGELEIKTECRPESCLSRLVGVLAKWEEHPLHSVGKQLNILREIAKSGATQAREVSRSLCVSLPILLCRFDSEFSEEEDCRNAISNMITLLETIDEIDKKLSSSIVLPCDAVLAQLCELLSGSGDKFAERAQKIRSWIDREGDSVFGKYTSFVSFDTIESIVKNESIDHNERLIVVSRTTNSQKISKEVFDEDLFKYCVEIARDGEPLKRVLREVDSFVRSGGSFRKQAQIQPAETRRHSPPRKKIKF